MSSWDRQAALKKYRTLFASSADEEALIEQLGTPAKLAIELAATYVPTLSPSALAQALQKCPVALEDLLRDPRTLAAELTDPMPEAGETPALQPETWVFDSLPEPTPDREPAADEMSAPEEPEEPVPPRSRVRTGALIAYLIPAIAIGLPVAVLLVCIGLPFLAGGAGLIWGAVHGALQIIGQLRLVSDMLLTVGAVLVACGVGLALCWLGLWLSMELCWLWVGRALTGLGRRLCLRKEAA